MIALIIGLLIVVGIIIAVACSLGRTPESLRGYYGSMFWTIAAIALVGVPLLVAFGFLF